MPTYVLSFEGREQRLRQIDVATEEDARNEAVRTLGAFLADNPQFASEGHWRVNVETENRVPLLHVIVATVKARRQ
ncbi:hypothetical protein GGR88_000219 [Sphingomonas jejuensis]|uniref:DUF6894 domain-containing protein n=1 Tax=Sphingomonas jejuensis TaxID=904715 RepID=A0ABX0XHP2_9SPHN|nr:hypothetical protein [Sphingomonas jejuensis]NJC32745.1 hypothetical protein [Sphingomonas jejuensis]